MQPRLLVCMQQGQDVVIMRNSEAWTCYAVRKSPTWTLSREMSARVQRSRMYAHCKSYTHSQPLFCSCVGVSLNTILPAVPNVYPIQPRESEAYRHDSHEILFQGALQSNSLKLIFTRSLAPAAGQMLARNCYLQRWFTAGLCSECKRYDWQDVSRH